MQYTFYRSGTGSYLVIQEEQLSEGYARRMLHTGGVPSLLEEHIVQIGECCELHYRISGMQSLEKRFARQRMRTQEAADLLDRIVRVQTACAAYLLPESHLFLTPDLIYVSHLQTDFYFLYLPEEETDFPAQIRSLADFLMKHISYENMDDPGVDLVYALQDAAGREGFDLRDWWRENRRGFGRSAADAGEMPRSGTPEPEWLRDTGPVYRDLRQDDITASAASAAAAAQPDFCGRSLKIMPLTEDWDMSRQDETYVDPDAGGLFSFYRRRKKSAAKERSGDGKREKKSRHAKKGRRSPAHGHSEKRKKHPADGSREPGWTQWETMPVSADMGQASDRSVMMQRDGFLREPVPFGEEEGTVLLTDPQIRCTQADGPHSLIPMAGGEEIVLDRTWLLVGSSARNADIVLQDPTVSRIHAEIFCDESGIRIEDCNSSNGTEVDGRMLGPNEQKTLEAGMHIRMGRTEFVFR